MLNPHHVAIERRLRSKTVEISANALGLMLLIGLLSLFSFFVCFFALIIALCR